MNELYYKLFIYGITMTTRPDRYMSATVVEFIREGKCLRFAIGCGEIDSDMLEYSVKHYLDIFIRENGFLPVFEKMDMWDWR